jgi:shikimate kinase
MPTFRTSQPVSAADPSLPHLVLVGLPGAGKSTVGALLASRLKRTFLDFDTEIERRQGETIAAIFGERGEGFFRELERGLTEEVRELGNMVLAPGGGWVTRPDNVALLRPPARMIYLKVKPDSAVRRMAAGLLARPLLNYPNPRGELERLLGQRKAAYESADLVIDVEHLDAARVTQRIIDKL